MEETKPTLLITQSLSDEQLNLLKSLAKDIEVEYHPSKTWDEISEDQWRTVNMLLTHRVLPPVEKAPNLRWIQTTLSGVDHWAESGWLDQSGVTITTSSGVPSLAVAEHVIGMFLALGHRFQELFRLQEKSE